MSINMQDEIQSQFNELKFQPGLEFSTPKMEHFANFCHYCERLHLRCLINLFMCLCCVRENDLSINFPTKSYLLLSCFLVCGDSKLWSFSTFSIYMNLIHLHYNWQQNRIVKIGDTLIYFYIAEVRNYTGIRP